MRLRMAVRVLAQICLFLLMALSCPFDAFAQGAEPEATGAALLTRTWKVPADLLQHLLIGPPRENQEQNEQDPIAAASAQGDRFYESVPRMLEKRYEVSFPPGSSIAFSPNKGELVARNTQAALQQIDKVLRTLGMNDEFVLDERLFRPIEKLLANAGEFSTGLDKTQWYVAPAVMEAFHAWCAQKVVITDSDPFNAEEEVRKQPAERAAQPPSVAENLQDCGIEIPMGASVTYDNKTGILTSVNKGANSFMIEMVFLDIAISVNRRQGDR